MFGAVLFTPKHHYIHQYKNIQKVQMPLFFLHVVFSDFGAQYRRSFSNFPSASTGLEDWLGDEGIKGLVLKCSSKSTIVLKSHVLF